MTSAPPSNVHSLVIGSLWTVAVRPTAEAPRKSKDKKKDKKKKKDKDKKKRRRRRG
jgi:hypothetical protein